jgi:NADPH:quinone reductase
MSMRAVVLDRFGGPDVLRMRDVPRPEPGPGELLVAVHACAVNPVDAENRADGSWGGIEPPAILGSDFSGVIEALGSEVTGWSVGDEVFGALPFRGNRLGTYAECCVPDARHVARKPEALSHAQAAAAPLAAVTARQVLLRLGLAPGERLLVHGAGGGVGTFAVQLAAAAGARVIAAASARHHELLRELGAELCVDYTVDDVAAATRERAGEVDAIADLVGGDALARSLPVLRDRGRAAAIADLEGDLELAIDKNATLHGVLCDVDDAAGLAAIARELSAGRLRAVIWSFLTLAEAAEAHRRIEAGHAQGKIVLMVREP